MAVMAGKSYHNFLFPFIFEKNNNVDSLNDIVLLFDKNPMWTTLDLNDTVNISVDRGEAVNEDFIISDPKLRYATYQYFQPAIRNAIFGNKADKNKDKDTVNAYYLNLIREKKYEYVIKASEYDYQKNSVIKYIYRMRLLDVHLRIYNTGVGILSFICRNEEYSDLADIKRINNYGRMLGLAFIPRLDDDVDRTKTFSTCPDYLGIEAINGDEVLCCSNFESILDMVYQQNNVAVDLQYLGIKEIIEKILWNQCEKKYSLISALDERMFVMCAIPKKIQDIISNESSSENIIDYISALESKNDIGDCCSSRRNRHAFWEKSLYELVFCDNECGCSCQSAHMRKKLLRESLYTRWLGYGTIYSIAAQSFIDIADWDITINYFRTEYYEMTCLVLAQRASLRIMQQEAHELTAHIEQADTGISSEDIKKVTNLQEKFLAFQNQLNLYEISSQEQAIELYDMFRERFLVSKHTENLYKQLGSLYDMANNHQNEEFGRQNEIFSRWALGISLTAILFAVPSFMGDFSLDYFSSDAYMTNFQLTVLIVKWGTAFWLWGELLKQEKSCLWEIAKKGKNRIGITGQYLLVVGLVAWILSMVSCNWGM